MDYHQQLEAVLLDYIERYGVTQMARDLYFAKQGGGSMPSELGGHLAVGPRQLFSDQEQDKLD